MVDSMKETTLLLLTIVAWYIVVTSADTYYVTPSPNTPCPEEGVSCFTLSQYANKSSNYFASNTTLILLPGNHSLDSELSFQNITVLSFESNTTSLSDTSITCYESAKFTFESISVVSMRGLALLGCMNNNVTKVGNFTVEDCSFDGQGRNGTGLYVAEVSIANIKRSSFTSNTGLELVKDIETQCIIQAGGAIIFNNITQDITIFDSIFQNNTITGYDYAYGGAVYVESAPNIIIVNSILNNNTLQINTNWMKAVYTAGGGALYVVSSSNVTIVNSTLNSNTLSTTDNRDTVSYAVDGAELNVLSSSSVSFSRPLNCFDTTNRPVTGGGALYASECSNVTIVNSALDSNTVHGLYNPLKVTGGGAFYAFECSNVTIVNSTLDSNIVHSPYNPIAGGALYTINTIITILHSTLNNNTVQMTVNSADGGAVCAKNSTTTIMHSTLNNNTVTGNGGALNVDSNSFIVNSTFDGNTATATEFTAGAGGAIYSRITGNLYLTNSTFNSNTVTGDGGAVFISDHDPIYGPTVVDVYNFNSTFSNNSCTGSGSVFHFIGVTFKSGGFLNIQDNVADTSGALYAIQSKLYFSGNTTVANNHGSFYVYSCTVTFKGHTNIVNNLIQGSNTSEEGGALSAIQSEIYFHGRINLMDNTGINGGAIAATESKLYVQKHLNVSHNTATVSGGGIYAYQSELNISILAHVYISRNSATIKGGGIHAISSTIRLTEGSKTKIIGNLAVKGGGLCLEGSAKIYLLKRYPEYYSGIHFRLDSNTADYGGAVYVSDNTTSATCFATPGPSSDNPITTDECFIQGIGLYFKAYADQILINTHFKNNVARLAGDVIYGGLLDRCKASPFAEILYSDKNLTPSSLSGVSYLVKITNLRRQNFTSTKTISSDPVRVCFCKDNQPDCNYHPQPKYVRKGEIFTVSLVAVDHINNSIANTTIHASVTLDGKLGEGQSRQRTSEDGSCTDLTYSIFTPHQLEELHLYADGPCMNSGISTSTLNVVIEPCPIGFQDNSLHERCDCNTELYPEYISNCSIDKETVQRKDNTWFSYVNATTHQSSYVLHKYCPFDYCKATSENISVDLNTENGANELCAFNRSQMLCGSCEDGLSLSLGSSHCRPCSNNWLALLIVFALAGVALVAFILKLNFTIAEGTLNGLIFYANIFVVNRAIFFPHDQTKILTVFIAWLNLDFGFETCFFDGMDSYAKTWLQFAFPLYIISLVVTIIIISEHSTKFARVVTAGKNPIGTLATLILLSYTKLLRAIIASLSVTTLQYSDGSSELVWLIDANIPYLSGKHIPLFVTALVIAIVGTAFTFILFAWQWLAYCSNEIKECFKRCNRRHQEETLVEQSTDSREENETVCIQSFRCINIIGNTKFISIMDAYHNPYNTNYRYWIGMLLIVRIVLYLVSALNVPGDPRINLLSIIVVIMTVYFLKQVVESKRKVHEMGTESIYTLKFNSTSKLEFKEMVKTLLTQKVYKRQLVEILEAISLLNLILLTSATFITEHKDSQNTVAYISTSIAFITFLVLLGYHGYKFILKDLFQKISSKFHMQRRQPTSLSANNRSVPTLHNTEGSRAEREFEVSASPDNLLTKSLAEDNQQFKTNASYEIEVSDMASGCRNSLLSPSVLVGTSSQEEDGSSQSEDEYTPLITQQ